MIKFYISVNSVSFKQNSLRVQFNLKETPIYEHQIIPEYPYSIVRMFNILKSIYSFKSFVLTRFDLIYYIELEKKKKNKRNWLHG